jgi:Ca2+-binding RTX toxin-like protein
MGYWPDGTNTGIPDGVVLNARTGDIVVTKAGTVLSGLDIRGTVYIQADNVTIENSKITSSGFSVINVKQGVTGTVVKDSELDGLGKAGKGIIGHGTFLRNEIHHVVDGIDVNGNNTHIEGNYIHDLIGYMDDPHYDGINIDASNVTVKRNTVIVDHSQTSALMVSSDWGTVRNVLVEDNLLVGAGYTVYAVTGKAGPGTLVDVKFIDNHFGKGQWGTFNTNTTVHQSGNTTDGHQLVAGLSDDGAYVPSNPSEPQPGNPDPVPEGPDPAPIPSKGATEGDDVLTGDASANTINGLGGNDRIDGGAGNDTINGGAGNDTIIGGLGRDTLTGGAGNDTFVFRSTGDSGTSNSTRDVITDFVTGQDKIDLSAIDANSRTSANDGFTFLAENDAIFTKTAGELAWHTDAANNRTIVQIDVNGDGKSDLDIALTGIKQLTARDFVGIAGTSDPAPTLPTTPTPTPTPGPTNAINGTSNADRLTGTNGDDIIDGRAGNDTLVGGNGNDVLIGGTGRDTLTGGAGNDVFQFKAVNEMGTRAGARDVITDFIKGQDKIDLSEIDANSRASGNQAFSFVAGDDTLFNKKPGEIAWHTEKGITVIQGDINGDGRHDFEIQLTGNIQLTEGDFIL